jgi:3-hydroxyacyl-CoA dehydrogenase/enoyl-CoA hydratase/3-hydroxybutyryl-CoA epimerase
MPYVNEAVLLVAEGQGIEEVDGVMRRFGMPMGPLQMLDQIGLDVAAHVADSMQPLLGAKYTPNPAFRRMSESGWLGQKAGAGFYRYRGKKARVNREVLALLRQDRPASASLIANLPRDVRMQQARDRQVLLMVNEAAACLGAGLVATPQDLDLALILATGWAPHRGGPLHFADASGIMRVVETLKDLAARFGPRYEPCEELSRRAGEGRHFYPDGFSDSLLSSAARVSTSPEERVP